LIIFTEINIAALQCVTRKTYEATIIC